MSTSWTEICVKTTTEAADLVAQAMFEAGAGGAVITDKADYDFAQDGTEWDYVDVEELTREMDDEVLVKAYLPEGALLRDRIALIRELLSAWSENEGVEWGSLEMTLNNINEEDWAENWKQYYKPTKICDGVVIKPSWESYAPATGETIIEMDPGMAFGTGTHETTRLCAQLIRKYIKAGDTVIDVGCGTGILAMTAAACGAAKVLAIDLDPNAVSVAERNVANNHMDGVIETRCANLLDNTDTQADVLVANIIADVIITLAKTSGPYIKKGGVMIASGIINDRADEVQNAFIENGFSISDRLSEGEWTAFAVKPESKD